MKTIVVATDFSMPSGKALREGVKLAEILNARILLVFVQNTTDIRYALKQEVLLDYQTSAELRMELAKFIEKKFNSFIRKYGSNDSRIQTLVLRGTPWQEITKLAREKKVDLVVVGSHGLSPLKTFFVGSTTQNLIRSCPCPVVVIHKTKRISQKKAVA